MAAALAGQTQGQAQGQVREVVLGMSAPFTGPARGLGFEFYRGALAAFQEERRQHPYALPPVHLQCRDDRYNPLETLRNTIRFLEDNVFCLFGYVGTPTTLRVLPLLARNESSAMTLLFPFTGSSALRTGPYAGQLAHMRASYLDEAEALVEQAVATGRRRIAVFYQADSFGRSGWESVRQALARRGLDIYAEAAYLRDDSMDSEYTAAVARIAPAGKEPPDAIVCVGLYCPTAGFIRDARKAGLQSLMVTMSIVDSDNLLLHLRREGERTGMDLTRNLVGVQVVPSYEDQRLPAVRAYRQAMERVAAPSPVPDRAEDYTPLRYSMVGLEGYLAAQLLLEALRRMDKDIRPERLREVLRTMDDFDLGINAPLHVSASALVGVQQVYFTEFQKDRVVPLQQWPGFAP
ncbi:hypothetical protein DGI_2654 [Megalodesulfovibrio gigas DSM 1382 = ATCC 19364]|uniref:Leucine-binding protein domain-containing protein n=2 Tax=Megalodesulfovibrio gigas TaxID=879 RepID=T2GCS6_MEGG1|nr:hypothetical protein DGI_2654 [Megalodesulfovibrio gigas DSM 1382 = ATCC 19364]